MAVRLIRQNIVEKNNIKCIETGFYQLKNEVVEACFFMRGSRIEDDYKNAFICKQRGKRDISMINREK
jgi:hypothetical protein